MVIAVAGPFSASTEKERQENLDALNAADATLIMANHVPLIGVNAALPVVATLPEGIDRDKAITDISMAVIATCEAVLVVGESPGANGEHDWFIANGLPVYYSLEEIPSAV